MVSLTIVIKSDHPQPTPPGNTSSPSSCKMVPRQRWRLVALVREADTEAEETARKEKLEVLNIIITETERSSYFDKTANNSINP